MTADTGPDALTDLIDECLASAAAVKAQWIGGLGGRRFEVRSDVPEVHRYLEQFAARQIGVTDYVVHHFNDPLLLRKMKSELQRLTSTRQQAFKGVYVRSYNAGTYAIASHEDLDAAYITSGPYTIVISADESNSVKLPIRVARERLLMEQGETWVHAASVVSTDGNATVIVGPSGSGKTTLALALAQNGGYGLVSNDYTIVRPGPGTTAIAGLPVPYRIGLGTVFGMKMLANSPLTMRTPSALSNEPDARRDPEDFGSSKKVEVTPAELALLLRSFVASSGRLSQVLIPHLVPEERRLFEVEDADARDLRRILHSEIRSLSTSMWPDRWLAPGVVMVEAKTSIFETLDSCPAKHVYFSPDALDTRFVGRLGISS